MGLLAELRADALSPKLLPALFTGALTGGLLLITCLVLANVIFSGPLSPFLLDGIGMMLPGCVIVCLLTALTSSYRGMISCPQDAPAAVLATIGIAATEIMAGASDEALFATTAVLMVLSTVVTGLCLAMIGYWRVAKLLRLIPYPVTAGFLAGTGWVLCRASLSTMGGPEPDWPAPAGFVEPAVLWAWGPGVACGLGLFLVAKRWNNFLRVMLSFALGIGLYHLGLVSAGISLQEAREGGLLFAGMPDGGLRLGLPLEKVVHADWNAVAALAPHVPIAALLTLLALTLNLRGLEMDVGGQVRADREFQVAGVAGLLAAATGSTPACQTFTYSRLSRQFNADTRLVGIIAALVVGLAPAFGGGLLGAVPVPLAAGVLLFFGIDVLNTWLIRLRNRLRPADYGIVLLILATIVAFGWVEGIGIGLLATAVCLLVRLGRMDTIDAELTGRDLRSTRRRTIPERAVLLDQQARIRVFRLKGYVFFGNVHRLVDRVGAPLHETPPPACIILDFAGVSGFESAAVNSLDVLVRSANATGTRLVLTGAPELVGEDLRRNLPGRVQDEPLFESNLDRCLERAEDLVLTAMAPATLDIARIFDDMAEYLDQQSNFEDMIDRLEPWLEVRGYEPGETLAAQGANAQGAQLLVQGQASSHDASRSTRLSQYGPGHVIEPLAAFGTRAAGATTIADTPCRAMLFTPNARLLLEELHPKLGLEVYRFLATREHGRQEPPRTRDVNGQAEAARLAPESRELRAAVDTIDTPPALAPAGVAVAPRDANHREASRTEERTQPLSAIPGTPANRDEFHVER